MAMRRDSLLGLMLTLAAASTPAACSSNDASGDSPDGGARKSGTGSTPGENGGSGGADKSSGASNTGAATNGSGASANGGMTSQGMGGSLNEGGTGDTAGSGGTSASGGDSSAGGAAMGGTGGAACTAKPAVSFNDATMGTDDGEFDYGGDWSTSMAAEKYDGDDHYSASTGATATIHFNGVSVALHAAHASHHGIAEVRLDNGSPTDVDLYGTDRAEDVEVWKSAALMPGEHTLRVGVSGRKNAASTGSTVSVDRVVVDPSTCTSGAGGAGGASSGGMSGTGGKATGGSAGAGGKAAAGGSSGSGGTGTGGSGGGAVSRPSYNTGTGFFVVGKKLYDANGAEFRIRGLNKLHWDADSPGIPRTHANTERWDIDFTRSASSNVALIQGSVNNHIVPMPGNWNGTCDENTSTLSGIVDTWVAQAATWKTMDKYMILDIANEWGPSGTGWRDAYVTAIGRLRGAGYLGTISVTSGGCGQDNDDLVDYAKAVFDSDPQKNVIFDQHIYGNWANGNGQSWQIDLNTALDKLAATGLPMIVGEFGPGRGIGPSPTDITPEAIMAACESRGIGWMAWAWDDPASSADDTWFALSKNGAYDSSNDLTMFGKSVVENAQYGLLVVAKPATIF
jgi:hypothetical protein